MSGNPTVAAQGWWMANQEVILANPAVDYWEGKTFLNEKNNKTLSFINDKK